MEVTRRQFIQLGGAAAATAAVPSLVGAEVLAPRPPLRWVVKSVADMPEPDLPTLLLNRAAFGPRPGEVEEAREKGADWWIERQLDYEEIDNSAVEGRLNESLPTLTMSARQLLQYGQTRNVAVQELRLATLYRMVFSPRLLHEVMVEFWTDHFSMYHPTDLVEYFKTVDDRDVIRRHALGNFKDLLTASAMSPAMLNFLNNDVSTKERPNENYAREIMELHTLGVAKDDYPYTEQDVKEVARCFTGWSWDRRSGSQTRGDFEYRDNDHYQGAKMVLGQPIPAAMKEQDGHIVIDILSHHEATPRFLATKLVRRFVTDDPARQTPELVERVAAAYTRTQGDIREMVSTILRSQEFKGSFSRTGGRLSRPMDLLARQLRAVDIQPEHFDLRYASDRGGLLYQRLMNALQSMGHIPYYWPTPDGYPDTKDHWVASTVMLTRWNFGLALNGVGTASTRFGPELINGFYPAQQTPAGLTTAGEVVDYWIERLLHRPMLAEDRNLVIDYLTNGGNETTRLNQQATRRIPETIALMLDSPYYQWR
jgi:uncharacterized protein (DUF1800 family)